MTAKFVRVKGIYLKNLEAACWSRMVISTRTEPKIRRYLGLNKKERLKSFKYGLLNVNDKLR
jgi:hypothetical protein